jgi:hypothetical protein
MSASEYNNKDQFINLYHISSSEVPPHMVDRRPPRQDLPRARLDETRAYNKTLFASDDLNTLTDVLWMQRHAVHTYSVPRAAIMPVVYGDDFAPSSKNYRHRLGRISPDAPNLGRGGTRGLWESVPLRPRDVIRSGLVHPFRNKLEGSMNTGLSYAIPIPNMKNLGIQYQGWQNREDILPQVLTERGKIVGHIKNGRVSDMDEDGNPVWDD